MFPKTVGNGINHIYSDNWRVWYWEMDENLVCWDLLMTPTREERCTSLV